VRFQLRAREGRLTLLRSRSSLIPTGKACLLIETTSVGGFVFVQLLQRQKEIRERFLQNFIDISYVGRSSRGLSFVNCISRCRRCSFSHFRISQISWLLPTRRETPHLKSRLYKIDATAIGFASCEISSPGSLSRAPTINAPRCSLKVKGQTSSSKRADVSPPIG